MKTYKTNYSVAINWCNNALILCNNITEIDPSVYDNMRFELFDEEDGTQRDIYQWFITDCTDGECECAIFRLLILCSTNFCIGCKI